MNNINSFPGKLYEVNDQSFPLIALQVFRYQAKNNPLYASFLANLRINPERIAQPEQIPFLPVSFFKRHAIQTEGWNAETVFTSSGTSASTQSQHFIRSLQFYLDHSVWCFEHHFGSLQNYHFLALLPSYLERTGSSLIAMMRYFIEKSGSPESGFYLDDYEKLLKKVIGLRGGRRKIILWGVTFALLDFAERFPADLSHCVVFETGGMKGRRREITRAEFHEVLKARLGVSDIYSEYGMTELMSQAYTKGGTRFINPPFMRVFGRDPSDPMQKGIIEETAGINIVDLANWNTISFLETEDLGKVYTDGAFEILGRMDNSDIRGCNLMI